MTTSPLDLSQISSWHDSGGLVVDADLEPGGAPVHELDLGLLFDCGNGRVDVLGNHVSPVQHATGHVLPVSGVTFHQLVQRVETRRGYFRHRVLSSHGC